MQLLLLRALNRGHGGAGHFELVPMNQKDRLEANLSTVSGLHVVKGHRCTGLHAAPWELGVPIWQSVNDILRLLQEQR